MTLKRRSVLIALVAFSSLATFNAQSPAPTSGELTVQLTQGLDSATNPKAMSQGRVTRSTNPAVPVGSSVLMGLSSDPVNGGYTVILLRLGINGAMVPAASSDVEAAPDFFNKAQERLRAKGQPQDAVKGTRVFLPEKMIVRFTLAAPPPPRPATPNPATTPVPVQTRVVPRHPAPSVVDLPPAFPGAPPLHASRAASDGCWWEPFGGKTQGFELPVQHCSDPANNSTFEETATGLGFRQGASDPGTAFTIYSKSAGQTVEMAIKTQFLKKPTDRTVCVVKKFDNLGSFQSFAVQAPHSTKTDCAGLYQSDSDATESTTFFYNPTESKTKYLKFTGEFIGVYPFDLQALRFVEPGEATASSTSSATANPASAVATTPASSEAAAGSLAAGPVGPVNRLNVRGISVRMGRGQILAAGQAAGMVVLSNKPQQIQMVDPTVTTQVPGKPRSGLILLINLVNDTAVSVNIGEQGGSHGEVFEDLSKKWGKPTHLPPGYNNELGTGDKATWGDKKTIYADYNPSIYSYGAQTVTIYDAIALAPHPQVRKAVPM